MMEFQNNFTNVHTTTIDDIEHGENKTVAIIDTSNEVDY